MKKDVWFEGRINRREYLARGTVCLVLILLALAPVFLHIVDVGRRVASRSMPEELFGIPVLIIACMISFGYILSASVRRLHDFGCSGWWLLGLVILDNILTPMFGKGGVLIWKTLSNLLLLLWPGTKGSNEYGEVPRFEVRKLMGRRFAMILAVMYVLEAALCGWAIVERRAREEAAKVPIPQVEVEGMLANLARANKIENYDQFNQRMGGHRLTLTNLTVRTVHGKGRGWKVVDCKTDGGWLEGKDERTEMRTTVPYAYRTRIGVFRVPSRRLSIGRENPVRDDGGAGSRESSGRREVLGAGRCGENRSV